MAGMTYRQAGVDIETTNRWLSRLKPLIRSTQGVEVLPDRGQFAGLFHLSRDSIRDPVLVSSTDGVGTKLKVAQALHDHASIGVDVVAMNTNDVLVYGAQPLFFLDYIAMGRINPTLLRTLVRGMVRGCRLSGCALVGGETAEMPGVYETDEYDVAGFCVGVAERRALIDGSDVRAGDVVVGLASSGLHANGFSLVRRVFQPAELKRMKRHLLAPTRIYVKPVLEAIRAVRVTAIAHVTGGGLSRRLESLVVKQSTLRVRWMPGRWLVPKIFHAIQAAGGISMDEMYATFNMGIGMALACRPRDANVMIRMMHRMGIGAWSIGTLARR